MDASVAEIQPAGTDLRLGYEGAVRPLAAAKTGVHLVQAATFDCSGPV
jgi:hypothetical protein